METVEDFIHQLEGDQKEIMIYLHNILINEFELKDKIRYKIPFYYGNSWICYLNPRKMGDVEMAFVRGNELPSYPGYLENQGRTQVFGITITTKKDIPQDVLLAIIQDAILLDETKPYASKRKKNDN